MVAKGDSNPGSLDSESGVLPLSYCALHKSVTMFQLPVWCQTVWRQLQFVIRVVRFPVEYE